MEPAGSSGPAKDSVSRPGGSGALGVEMGAESDARREREDAIAQGDKLPEHTTARSDAGALGFGQQNGAEQGVPSFNENERSGMQETRNKEVHSKGPPNLATIAKTSGASGSTNPTANQDNITSTGNRAPGEILETASRSRGQPDGTGATDGQVTRDAPTNY